MDRKGISPRRFAGRSVLITGGARGIGFATARRFLREGAGVVVMDIDRDALDAAQSDLARAAAGGEGHIMCIAGDVGDEADVDAAVRTTMDTSGRIDILIDNAGIAYQEPFLSISRERWNQVLSVNLTGMFLVAQRVAAEMVRQREGVILFTSSTNGLTAEDHYAHYNASKGGVTLLTKSLAIELGPHNIRVSAVCPGYILTPLNEAMHSPEFIEAYAARLPLRRVGRPDDVAAAFAFLASDDAAFITGATLVVDGGQLADGYPAG